MIVFDLDGTLVDSIKDITTAINLTFNDFGFETATDSIVAQWIGVGVAGLIDKVFADARRDDSAEGLKTFNSYYLRHVADQTALYPGALTLIDTPQRKVILTNKSNIFLQPLLDKLELGKYFEGVYGRESFSTRKPDPGPLLMIAQQHRVAIQDMIMIGDTEIDILAGQRAGTKTCAVTYGYGDARALTALSADFIAHSPAELRRILNHWPTHRPS